MCGGLLKVGILGPGVLLPGSSSCYAMIVLAVNTFGTGSARMSFSVERVTGRGQTWT